MKLMLNKIHNTDKVTHEIINQIDKTNNVCKIEALPIFNKVVVTFYPYLLKHYHFKNIYLPYRINGVRIAIKMKQERSIAEVEWISDIVSTLLC